MKGKIGLTGEQFIMKIEKEGGVQGDVEVLGGITEEEFKNLIKKNDTITGIIRGLKQKGFTDFSWGWGSRMAVQAIQEIKKMEQMLKDPALKKLAELMGGGTAGTEQMARGRDIKKLSYID
jgi:hypothetical protein